MSSRKSLWEHFPHLREEAPQSDVIAVYGATCETTKEHTVCSGDLFITHTHVAFAGGDKEREEKYLIPFCDIRSISQANTVWLLAASLTIVRYRGRVGDPLQYVFSNMTSRDEVYSALMAAWENAKKQTISEKAGDVKAVEEKGGREKKGEKIEKEEEKDDEASASVEKDKHHSDTDNPGVSSSPSSSSSSSSSLTPSSPSPSPSNPLSPSVLGLSLFLLSLILFCCYLQYQAAPLHRALHTWSAANHDLENTLLFAHSVFQHLVANASGRAPPLSLPPPIPHGLREQVDRLQHTVATLERELTDSERALDDVMQAVERASLLFSIRSFDVEGDGDSHFVSAFVLPLVGLSVCVVAASWLHAKLK